MFVKILCSLAFCYSHSFSSLTLSLTTNILQDESAKMISGIPYSLFTVFLLTIFNKSLIKQSVTDFIEYWVSVCLDKYSFYGKILLPTSLTLTILQYILLYCFNSILYLLNKQYKNKRIIWNKFPYRVWKFTGLASHFESRLFNYYSHRAEYNYFNDTDAKGISLKFFWSWFKSRTSILEQQSSFS